MLTAVAFARDRLVVMLVALLALGGLAPLPGYSSQEDPVIPVNEAMVTASSPGLDLAETEALLARPLERTMRAMPETKSTITTVRAGAVHLRVEIRDGTPDYGLAWERLRALGRGRRRASGRNARADARCRVRQGRGRHPCPASSASPCMAWRRSG